MRHLLHRHGYKYIQAHRKGILTLADYESRLKFACGIKREYSSSLWTEQVAFYLDGVSFVHRYKPADQARSMQGRIWRKPEEALSIGCTTKESHCGSGGGMAKFMVVITYRGVVLLCEQYEQIEDQGSVKFQNGYINSRTKRLCSEPQKKALKSWSAILIVIIP